MKSPKIKLALLAIGLTAAAGTLVAMRWRGEERPLELAGSIEAGDVEIGSQVGGRVETVHVREGDAVAANAPIVTLETRLLDAQIAEQQGRLAEARAKLELLVRGSRPEDVAQARLEWENAERDRVRMERLLQGGVAAQQQYDAVATHAALLREALNEHENGSRPEDIAAARAAVAREDGRLAFLTRQREETVVRSPGPGMVQTLDLRPGDLVAAGAPVARLVQTDDQWVRGYVPEPQLGRVHVGQRASVKVDTWRDRSFPGVVTEIRTRAEYTPRNVQTLDQRSEQVFAVKVTLEPSAELRPGMAAIVTLAPAAKGARP